MLLIRSLVMDLLMYLMLPVIGLLYAPRALWSVDGAYAGIKAYCRVVFWLLRVICGLRVEIRGTVPQGDVIVCSKHQSFLDIMMLAEALPRAKFIMKKSCAGRRSSASTPCGSARPPWRAERSPRR